VSVSEAADREHMRRALELAGRGWGRVAPNPLVGAVLVRDGEVVGEGWHAEYGQAHAEVAALRQAGERARGATAYVTLEPCSHHGKTPPCSDALIAAGVRKVVYAAADPDPAARGGAQALAAAGIEVAGGVEESAARDLNASFFHAHESAHAARPWIQLKLALSLDARIADADGRSGWITGEDARAEVHRLRAAHDAIAVGIGTALADDPLLTVRGPVEPRVAPVRIVFDRRLRLPLRSKLARSAAEPPVWVVAEPGAPGDARLALEDAGVQVVEAAGIAAALAALRERGIRSLFCEGGAGIAAALLREEAVDRLTLFYAPLLLGEWGLGAFGRLPGGALPSTPRWRHLRSEVFGGDTLITLARRR
jgi:diaminohydroxyphosphoribosylaminopyrimidine deaminase/5-amino-6-(5-phosphoribosylamino)uracil reductase